MVRLFFSSFLCFSAAIAAVTAAWLWRCTCTGPKPSPAAHHPPPLHYPCLRALLAQACLSIFVTASKFDVSYPQLKASEPCMNELTIYTKCLIKSAAAPGINIAGRLGMLARRTRVFTPRGVHVQIPRLTTRQLLCASPAHTAWVQTSMSSFAKCSF